MPIRSGVSLTASSHKPILHTAKYFRHIQQIDRDVLDWFESPMPLHYKNLNKYTCLNTIASSDKELILKYH